MYAYHIVPKDEEYVVKTCKYGKFGEKEAPKDDCERSFFDLYPDVKDK